MQSYSEDDIAYIMATAQGPDPGELAATWTNAPRAAKPKAAPQPSAGFADEALRVVLGGARDAVQGTIDAIEDIDAEFDRLARRAGLPGTYIVTGRDASNGVVELVSRDTAMRRADARPTSLPERLPEVAPNQTTGGKIGRDIVEFGTSFAGGMRALRGMQSLGTVGRMARPVAAGAAAAFVDIDPMAGNLANLAKQLGVPENVLTDALAVDEDDEALTARFKNAATDMIAGVALDAAVSAMVKGVRAVRGMRSAKDSLDRQAAVPDEVLRHAPELDLDAAQSFTDRAVPQAAARAELAAAREATQAVEEVAPRATPEAAPEAAQAATRSGEQLTLFDDLPEARAPDVADELEQTLFNIPRRVEGLDEKALNELAEAFHSGTKDYEVLKRLGLNPARIDFSKVLAEDVGAARVGELVERIAEATLPIAMRAGSQPRSWTQTAALANLIGASEGQVVMAFKGKTQMLDAYAWGARQLLGGSAARLTALAEQARNWVNDPTHPTYIEFLKALEAHAALQAQFKAATSNLGRALASLRGTATAKDAVQRAARIRALGGEAKDRKAQNSAEDALRALGDAKSPNERRLLLDKIIRAKGNTADLTKLAERYSGPRRWQRAIREYITGNLFSLGTATVNVISTTGHMVFRALSRLPVQAFAYASGKAGGREYVAARVADTAYLGALIPGFAKGAQQVIRLLSDDLTEEFQGLAGSFGSNKVESKLARLREFMDRRWGAFTPRFERVDAVRAKEWRISKDQIDALMEAPDQLPALLRLGLRGLIGLGTGAFNSLGSTARIVRLATIDVADELFGTAAEHATKTAHATRLAALEAYDRGLSGDELAKYTRQRADVLLKHTSTELLERAEKLVALGARPDSDEVFDLASEAARALEIETLSREEAQKLLFQDDLNWSVNQWASRGLSKLDAHTGLIFPFIRTPMKILETTLGDYTPLGLLQRETRDRLQAGGYDAQVVISQMAMGSLLISGAVTLAQSGMIVGHDGGFRSSSRMERPQYSVKIGGQWVEFSRFDPFGMLLGFGADLHEQMTKADEAEDLGNVWKLERAASAMVLAFNRNVLSKTWLTGIRDFLAAVTAQSDAEAEAAMDRFISSSVQKFVPAGGMIRWWEGEDTGVLREAQTLWERAMASTPWSDDLPVRRDTLLGRPVEYGRVLGIQAGNDKNDPLVRELSNLHFDLPPNTRSFRGVELTSRQMSRLKELRGQVVADISGLTFEERLRDLIQTDEYLDRDRNGRVRMIQRLRDDYHDLAIEALREEDREFDQAVEAVRLRRRLEKQGTPEAEISAELQRFKKEFLDQ
ncbi:MAG: hypothetical protein ACK4TR_08875 [Phenylobacterium sp.]|uniref:hypothetical protein n=1 Tax=Phenylobacterium sp. TaxID=1871053 RepID=UPI00391D5084